MDVTPASANGSGFDAALKALEDLETSVVQTREEAPVPSPVPVPVRTPAVPLSIAPAEPDPVPPLSIAIADQPAVIIAVPVVEAEPVAAPAPEAPAVPVHADAPAVAAEPLSPPVTVVAAPSARLGKVAVGLGLLSSLLSTAGLIVAERTIMSAKLVVADARERQQQLRQANELIRQLQLVRDKQVELLQAQRVQATATPVTSEELQRKMDALQTGLLARDPLNNVIEAIRAGQSDTNERFSEFGMKMARVEAALNRDGR